MYCAAMLKDGVFVAVSCACRGAGRNALPLKMVKPGRARKLSLILAELWACDTADRGKISHRSSTAPARSMIMRALHKSAIWNPMAQYIYTMNRVSKIVPPKRVILRDISLSFFPGAKIGVLGANGAGKSTLLRIAAGLTDVQSR